jgi:hypothetical protein
MGDQEPRRAGAAGIVPAHRARQTGGKWIARYATLPASVISEDRFLVANVVNRSTPGETEANCRLIAEAPKLLRVVTMFIEILSEHGDWEEGCFYYNGSSASELQLPLTMAEQSMARVSTGPVNK